MDYTITWLENKETKVGPKYNVNLRGPQGEEIKDVTMWPRDWPGLMNGQTVKGDLVPAKDPKYGPSLDPAKTYKTFAAKPNNISKAQDTKREDIKQAQEVKHEAIKMAGAQRDAVLLTTTFYPNLVDEDDIKQKIEYWYRYFMGDIPF